MRFTPVAPVTCQMSDISFLALVLSIDTPCSLTRPWTSRYCHLCTLVPWSHLGNTLNSSS
jgi:hypothetical protein